MWLQRLAVPLAIMALVVGATAARADQSTAPVYASMTKAELLELLAAQPKADLIRLLTAQQDEANRSASASPAATEPVTHGKSVNRYVLLGGTLVAAFAAATLMNRHTGSSGLGSGSSGLQTSSVRRVLDTTATPTPTCNSNVSFSDCTAYPLHQVTCNLFAGITSASSLLPLGIDTTPAGTPTTVPISATTSAPAVAVNNDTLQSANRTKNQSAIIGFAVHIAQIAANCTNGQPAAQ